MRLQYEPVSQEASSKCVCRSLSDLAKLRHPGSEFSTRGGYFVPLSSEYGTHEAVKARIWPWLSGKSPREYGTHETVKARLWPWLSGKSPQILLGCSIFVRNRADACMHTSGHTGAHRSYETNPSQDPTLGLLLGPYGGPRRGRDSFERGTPVRKTRSAVLEHVSPIRNSWPLKWAFFAPGR